MLGLADDAEEWPWRVWRQARRRGARSARHDAEPKGRATERHLLLTQPDMQLVRADHTDRVVHTMGLDELAVRVQPPRLDASEGEADAARIGLRAGTNQWE